MLSAVNEKAPHHADALPACRCPLVETATTRYTPLAKPVRLARVRTRWWSSHANASPTPCLCLKHHHSPQRAAAAAAHVQEQREVARHRHRHSPQFKSAHVNCAPMEESSPYISPYTTRSAHAVWFILRRWRECCAPSTVDINVPKPRRCLSARGLAPGRAAASAAASDRRGGCSAACRHAAGRAATACCERGRQGRDGRARSGEAARPQKRQRAAKGAGSQAACEGEPVAERIPQPALGAAAEAEAASEAGAPPRERRAKQRRLREARRQAERQVR